MSTSHLLEVVCRGSETQLQVGEKKIHFLRRWPNITPTLVYRLVFARSGVRQCGESGDQAVFNILSKTTYQYSTNNNESITISRIGAFI